MSLKYILSFSILYISLICIPCAFCHQTLDLVSEHIFISDNARFNGAILVTKGDKLIYQKTCGKADCEQNTHIATDSQFLIGSISKQITAVLILREVDKEKIHLSTPVYEIIPEIEDDWTKDVTIHHLLNHTSGVKAFGQPLGCIPGDSFAYSNFGYDLLGKILERITGKSYATLAQELFSYCGMDQSAAPESGTFLEMRKAYPQLALGYTEGDERPWQAEASLRESSQNPSGGLISSISDLQMWNHCLHHGKLLKAETYQKMITPSTTRNHRWGVIGYGYGVQVSSEGDILEISHNGIIPGYMSFLVYYPEYDVTLAILENRVYWTKEWGIPQQKAVFFVHDAMREVVRKYIQCHIRAF